MRKHVINMAFVDGGKGCYGYINSVKAIRPLNAITILDMLTVSIQSALKHNLGTFESYFLHSAKMLSPPQLKQQLPEGASA